MREKRIIYYEERLIGAFPLLFLKRQRRDKLWYLFYY